MEVTEGGNDGEIVPKVGDSPAENSTASHKEAILQVSIEKEDVNGHDNDDDSTSESSKKHRKDKKKKKHKASFISVCIFFCVVELHQCSLDRRPDTLFFH